LGKNILLNLFITLVIGALSFLINRIFSDVLGKEALGLMSLMAQLVAYLNLVDMGITTAATYALYKPLSQNDYEQVNIIYSTIDRYFKIVAFVIFILGLIIGLFLPYIAHTQSFGNYIYLYWFLYIINTVWSYLNAKYSILLTANQEYGYILKISSVARVLIKILQIVVLLYFKSFILFILLFNILNIFNSLFLSKKIKKDYSWLKKVNTKYKKIKTDMKNMFWHKIAEMIVFNTDYIIISIYTSLKVVAVYSTYMMVYYMILTVINVISPILNPLIGRYISQNNNENIYKLWQELHSFYVFMATIVSIVTFYTINHFIYLWMGKDYLLSEFTVFLIVINMYFTISRGVLEIFKNNTGVYDDIYNPILESLANLVLSLILVRYYGLDGVIIGTIISNLLVIYILKPLVVFKKSFKKTYKDYIIEYTKYTILSIVSIILTGYLIKYFDLKSINWINFIEYVIKNVIISTFITFFIFLLDKNFRKLLIRLKKRIQIV